MQTDSQVIKATLKAASIRAAATIMASGADAYKAEDKVIAEGVVALAVLIYRDANAAGWETFPG